MLILNVYIIINIEVDMTKFRVDATPILIYTIQYPMSTSIFRGKSKTSPFNRTGCCSLKKLCNFTINVCTYLYVTYESCIYANIYKKNIHLYTFRISFHLLLELLLCLCYCFPVSERSISNINGK